MAIFCAADGKDNDSLQHLSSFAAVCIRSQDLSAVLRSDERFNFG